MGDGDDGDDVLVDENHLDLLMVRVQWGENTDGALVHLRTIQMIYKYNEKYKNLYRENTNTQTKTNTNIAEILQLFEFFSLAPWSHRPLCPLRHFPLTPWFKKSSLFFAFLFLVI